MKLVVEAPLTPFSPDKSTPLAFNQAICLLEKSSPTLEITETLASSFLADTET